MKELSTTPDRRFAVVQSEPWMAEQLEAIQAASFPDLAPEELMRQEHYLSQMQVFPEGQLALFDREQERIAGCSTDFRTQVDFSHYQHKYIEAVAGNYLTNHQPDGDWLYGADIGIHPDYRGYGLSSVLYAARHLLAHNTGLRGHVAGAMPKGYSKHQHKMPIEEYVGKVIKGELNDPVLSIQLRRGYNVWGIIPDYLEDPTCANYGVFIVWRNPDIAVSTPYR